jgi:hypothetical protein
MPRRGNSSVDRWINKWDLPRRGNTKGGGKKLCKVKTMLF